ncbi:MAG: methionine adenosyltransferase, partial [SAR116 cluster bacterium]|nr:methionine adenosyltransferase [SAR116 cluster bacterium]
PSLMPAPIHYSHEILKKLAELRHSGKADFLGPDSKSQLTIEYDNERPIKAHKIVVSSQHKDGFNQTELKDFIMSFVKSILPEKWMCHNDDFYVNPTGRFVIGGPDGDTGLTGRKIIVDTYGGSSPHGGGAFSGKDPTKVDRSAAYMTRYLAKNVVAAKLAKKCTIQIAYGIGISKPLSFYVNTQGTGEIEDLKIQKCLEKIVDLTPKGIRDHLALNNPIYVPSSSYGHFGRQPDEKVKGSFSWEKVDLVEKILNEINTF